MLIDAVAVTTKSGHLFLFHRDTGESLYEIYEVDGLPSELPGEQASPTQPVSAVAFTRQKFEMTTRNTEAIAHVSEVIEPPRSKTLGTTDHGRHSVLPFL